LVTIKEGKTDEIGAVKLKWASETD
jgi:hypothetical protein